jgi:putative flavoprotein involved in K+ transport
MAKKLRILDVAVIGAGAAGVGMSYVLQHLGIERYLTLEKNTVGYSFENWVKGMRFITPSFTSNSFGSPDLNAITYNTSPAYTLKTEHPTGKEYAHYLRGVVKAFDLHVEENIEVFSVKKREIDGLFVLDTSRGEILSRFVIWAAGEFQFPNLSPFEGAEHALHNSQVADWRELSGDDFVIIGGYESGIDAAFHLTKAGKKVKVLDFHSTWESKDSDPSVSLSPFTQDRLRKAQRTENVQLLGDIVIDKIVKKNGHFLVLGSQVGHGAVEFKTSARPILATGFDGSLKLVKDLFEFDEDDRFALLTEQDESTITENLFLIGSQVRHKNVIFCFIYKFRQRFAVVANTIAEKMDVDTSVLEEYRKRGMYLDDLSCCTEQCEC